MNINQLLQAFHFSNLQGIRSDGRGRTKGCVYACIIGKKYIYVGITENSLTQRILEHRRHPTTKFSRLLGASKEEDILWGILEVYPNKHDKPNSLYKEELGNLEKKWIKKLGSFSSKFGLNSTTGGKGTEDYTLSPESIHNMTKRQKKRFEDPAERRKTSIASRDAHRLNPKIAEEHSQFMTDRFNGSDAEREREKVAEGMRKHLSTLKNREIHSWKRGSRPFVVVSRSGIQGFFLSSRECARALNMLNEKIGMALSGKRNSHKGCVFILIGLGMTHEEIMTAAEEKLSKLRQQN